MIYVCARYIDFFRRLRNRLMDTCMLMPAYFSFFYHLGQNVLSDKSVPPSFVNLMNDNKRREKRVGSTFNFDDGDVVKTTIGTCSNGQHDWHDRAT